jgi:hypothetical protein
MKIYLLPLVMVAVAFLSGSASATVHYVDLTSTNATSPYTDWATAATNIQDAVDASTNGDLILVTNGVYRTGGRVVSLSPTNRVVLDKAVTMRSVNGPAVTVIQGNLAMGSNAVRCVYLTMGAVLSGFMLTQGAATRYLADDYFNQAGGGGGVWCWWPAKAMVTNCVLSNNLATAAGAGAYGCFLNNCVLISNVVHFDAGWGSLGGGGAYYSDLTNCTLVGNSAWKGGGAHSSGLNNCTIIGNQAMFGGVGGGTYGGTLRNCIVYDNTAPNDPNCSGGTLSYCCTLPLPTNGVGNITNDPAFLDQVGGNFRLQSNSPCINAGNNSYVSLATDLDGNPRIVGGTVDIGAYECQSPALFAYYAWLQNYGLPTDASAAYADSDGDGMNNWQEYLADTSPLDANDFLRITTFTRSGTYNTLWWTSKSTRLYQVQRRESFDAASSWETIITNAMPGWNNVGFDNTGPQYFYRIQAVWP